MSAPLVSKRCGDFSANRGYTWTIDWSGLETRCSCAGHIRQERQREKFEYVENQGEKSDRRARR